MTTATVTIGKREYQLAPLVFDQMERAWPFLKRHSDAKLPSVDDVKDMTEDELAKREMEATRDAISIIAIALESVDLTGTPLFIETPVDPTDDQLAKISSQRAIKIRKTMLAGEIPMIRHSILSLLEVSGLATLGNVQMEVDQFMADLQKQIGLTATSEKSSDFSSPQA